jgi:hypothetical protein
LSGETRKDSCPLWVKSGHRSTSRESAEAARLARRALELSKDDAAVLASAGYALALVVGDLDAGIGFVDRALQLNSNLAMAWLASGWLRVWLGEPSAAIEHFATLPEWRAVIGEETVLRSIVSTLDRSADYLMWIAAEHPDLRQMREICGHSSITDRLSVVLDQQQRRFPE